MPSGAAWVDLPSGVGHGNPTRHKSINKLIARAGDTLGGGSGGTGAAKDAV